MPTYTNEPPNDPRGHSLQLMRCPTGRPVTAIVTSVDLVGTPTHFWHGRTIPCEVDQCEPCEAGMPWRWHGYLAALQPTEHFHFLFEFTARSSRAFLEYKNSYGSLRGCLFQAKRVNMAPNARVIIQTRPADLAKIKLPDPPDLVKVLSMIWNIATPDMAIGPLMKNLPRVMVDSAGKATQLRPGAGPNGKQHDSEPDDPPISRVQHAR